MYSAVSINSHTRYETVTVVQVLIIRMTMCLVAIVAFNFSQKLESRHSICRSYVALQRELEAGKRWLALRIDQQSGAMQVRASGEQCVCHLRSVGGQLQPRRGNKIPPDCNIPPHFCHFLPSTPSQKSLLRLYLAISCHFLYFPVDFRSNWKENVYS